PSLNSFTRRNTWRLLFNAVSRSSLVCRHSGRRSGPSGTGLQRQHALRSTSILDRYALDVVTLEIFAGGLGLVLVEPGKAGAVIGGAPLIHRFGKRIGTGKHLGGLALHQGEALLRLLFGRIGPHLDHPAAANLRFGGGYRRRLEGRGAWRQHAQN